MGKPAPAQANGSAELYKNAQPPAAAARHGVQPCIPTLSTEASPDFVHKLLKMLVF
jgi:hypothetical protein